ncbi:hypothetical protein [Corallococcus aberystwythensis]|uniref:Uncharacterized protein n=1 Tax=Corallococcus aberystwythensis TaxID=2316722 RepID=A0A3A8PJF3_9BACT|nr:hypothetical protein [Corallococcus aberystwythensis]RKH56483.1 hypothetical protein D7W81_33645 [Corallococcus aberystwythensis]
MAAAIKDFRVANNVGGAVLGFTAFLRLFGLYNVDAERAQLDALLKIGFSDHVEQHLGKAPDGTVALLSAPNTWGQVSRDTFARLLQYEALNAANRGEREERQMWLHLRDIILNYERYEDGGIRFDSENFSADEPVTPARLLDGANTPKLMLRSMPGENHRSVAGIEGPFSWADLDQLARLCSVLSYDAQAADYLATADFTMDLDFTRGAMPRISKRDAYLLNHALLSVDDATRSRLRQAFRANKNNSLLASQLWSKLYKFLDGESWYGAIRIAGDSEQDRFGFWHDLPEARTEDHAFWPPFQVPNYYRAGPAPLGAYTYYWSAGPALTSPPSGWTFYWPGSK